MSFYVGAQQENVAVMVAQGTTPFLLTEPEAMALAMALLRECDAARGYGEWKRGEVPNPENTEAKRRARRKREQERYRMRKAEERESGGEVSPGA